MLLFVALGMATLLINSFAPGLRTRRRIAGVASRAFFRGAGIAVTVQGLERLPGVPCVVVVNHASYLDGIVAVAALPPEFAFVIMKEIVRVPLAGALLRRLGSEFVERFDRHKSAADARRVLRVAAGGQSLVFFPEGRFDGRRQVGRFLGGAFSIAQRARHARDRRCPARHPRRASRRQLADPPPAHPLRNPRRPGGGGGAAPQPRTDRTRGRGASRSLSRAHRGPSRL